jgi:Glycosyl transferase family 2
MAGLYSWHGLLPVSLREKTGSPRQLKCFFLCLDMTENQRQLAPIAVFAYNRPRHLRQTLEALLANPEACESDLFVFSDGPRNELAVEPVREVRAYLKEISGFKSITIVEREQNFGLAKSIITGVTQVCGQYGKVIVLEDDLVTSPYFLKYMNDALNHYEFEDKVISILAYVFPVKQPLPETFFLRGAGTLGWATWQRGWSLFEADGKKLLDSLKRLNLLDQFDYNGAYSYTDMLKRQIAGKNNSWAIRWHASAYIHDKLTLHPAEPLVKHIGDDGSGTNYGDHSGADDFMGNRLSLRPIRVGGIAIEHDLRACKLYEQHFRSFRKPWPISLIYRIVNKVKKSLFYRRRA